MAEGKKKNSKRNTDTFSIIETGGKQYKVSSGDTVLVEKIDDSHKTGDSVVFDKVLMRAEDEKITLGDPYIKGAYVEAIFEGLVRGKKVTFIRFKSKSHFVLRGGHRQTYAKIKIL